MSLETVQPAREPAQILARAVPAPLLVPWRSGRQLPGAAERKSWARGNTGYDTISHRPYVPGDPSKKIDWQASSRTDGEILVKETREDRPITITLIVDNGAAMAFGSRSGRPKSAVCQDVVASIIMSARITSEAVAAIFMARGDVHKMIPPASSPSFHMVHEAGLVCVAKPRSLYWRDWLWRPPAANRKEVSSSGLASALKRLPNERSVVFIVTDHSLPRYQDDVEALAAACARHDVRCVLISDSRERELPAADFVLLDMNSGEELEVDEKSRSLYAANFKRSRDAALKTLARVGCQWIELGTEYDTATVSMQVARLLSNAGDRRKEEV